MEKVYNVIASVTNFEGDERKELIGTFATEEEATDYAKKITQERLQYDMNNKFMYDNDCDLWEDENQRCYGVDGELYQVYVDVLPSVIGQGWYDIFSL